MLRSEFLKPRRAVGEDGPDARLLQRLDGRVGVFRRGLNVGPVEQGGDAGIDGAQGADQVAGVYVLRTVRGREGV